MNSFGGWSITHQLFEWISKNLPVGRTILELGSGNSTKELANYWKIFSVEEQKEFVGLHHDNYIYAPIKDDYYDTKILKEMLPSKYDLLLVDGPAYGDRKNMVKNLDLFLIEDSGCSIIVFDDVERKNDFECYNEILEQLGKVLKIKETQVIKGEKNFAYIKI